NRGRGRASRSLAVPSLRHGAAVPAAAWSVTPGALRAYNGLLVPPTRATPACRRPEHRARTAGTLMRVQLRIVAGSLRGRKILCQVHPALRPTPQMVREALFSILGNAVPDRPFVDVFAGTGANGMEA